MRAGPPDPDADPERAKNEKWCRVQFVVPAAKPRDDGSQVIELSRRGPFPVPMAIRRAGSDLGSRDAWIFFTHPYAAFPREAAFWNAPRQRGILEARLVRATPHGIELYDEVGVAKDADPVSGSLPQALGVLRSRTLAAGESPAWFQELLRLEIDVLESFRLLTLCMKTRSPINALAELHGLVLKPAVRAFVGSGTFAEEDLLSISRAAQARSDRTFDLEFSHFRVDGADFVQSAEIRDGRGRQLLVDLVSEWEAFTKEHGARIEKLGREIAECDAEDRKLRLELEREKDSAAGSKIGRFLSGADRNMKRLDDQRRAVMVKRRSLEGEFDTIPGYARVRGLTDRVEGFKKTVDGIARLATNVFDHNVTQQTIKQMEELVLKYSVAKDEDRASVQKSYDQRLRADVLPRVLAAYSISAYVLRRPDTLADRGKSRTNVRRLNRFAEDLLDYFRAMPFKTKTLGATFEETWGQVRKLEESFVPKPGAPAAAARPSAASGRVAAVPTAQGPARPPSSPAIPIPASLLAQTTAPPPASPPAAAAPAPPSAPMPSAPTPATATSTRRVAPPSSRVPAASAPPRVPTPASGSPIAPPPAPAAAPPASAPPRPAPSPAVARAAPKPGEGTRTSASSARSAPVDPARTASGRLPAPAPAKPAAPAAKPAAPSAAPATKPPAPRPAAPRSATSQPVARPAPAPAPAPAAVPPPAVPPPATPPDPESPPSREDGYY